MPLAIDNPRPAPVDRPVALRPGLEHVGRQFGSNPGPVVRHSYGDGAPGFGTDIDGHPDAWRVMPEGILEKVDEHLLEAVVVRPDGANGGIAIDRDRHGRFRGEARDGRLEHQPEVAPVGLEAQKPGLDGREVQQVADQASHPGRLAGDPVQEPRLGLIVPGHVRGEQAAGVAPDGGERRAQLVAQPGEEVPL